jgi:hypothetical protein
MARQSFSVTRATEAPREAVWALVSNAASWKDWAGVLVSSLEKEGDPSPDGVGAIRKLGPRPFGSREQVVVWEPPYHLGYVILSGIPVRNYRADIILREVPASGSDPAETTITWSATFDAKLPGTGALLRVVLKAMIGRFAERAVSHAVR